MNPVKESADRPGWLDQATWELAQRNIPIACVDIVPVKVATDGMRHVGLIQRLSPFPEGLRWCQLGGRIDRGETVRDALLRHLDENLTDFETYIPADPQPDYVMQWFPDNRLAMLGAPEYGTDPRKHAIALSFTLELTGEPKSVVGAEAQRFAWFTTDEIAEVDGQLWEGTAALLRALRLL
jgi:ADP-ribose pyrophosphatase YjhB (NUDIX family)